jgi:hypothetical protein
MGKKIGYTKPTSNVMLMNRKEDMYYVQYIVEIHDAKSHVEFTRMRENQLCLIYLTIKLDFFNLKLIIY